MRDIAYYNGVVGAIDEVRAPVTDRGFYFGDGVYDAAIARGDRIFALDDHLDRFYRSLALLRISPPMERGALAALLRELCGKVDGADFHMLYWQATRGNAHRRHTFPADAPPSLLIFVEPVALDPVDKPMRLLSLEDTRFLHCNIKTLNLIPNVMALQQAAEAGCEEVVYHRNGRVTEGAHSGLALLWDGVFCTPPADELILPSVTRLHCLQLCEKLGIPTRIAPFTLDELRKADEVLILSTGSHCVPACALDGAPIGGKAPALLRRLQQAYHDKFEAEIYQQ